MRKWNEQMPTYSEKMKKYKKRQPCWKFDKKILQISK